MFRIVSLTVVLTLIVVLGITFFKVVAPFLLPLFVAGVVAILAQPLFLYFVRRTKGRVRLASGLTTATLVLTILVPLVVGTAIASMRLYVFSKDISQSSHWDEMLGSVQAGAGSRTESVAEWLAYLVNEFRQTPAIEPTPDAGTLGMAAPEPSLDNTISADGVAGTASTVAEPKAVTSDPPLPAPTGAAEPAETERSADEYAVIVSAGDEITPAIRDGASVTPAQVKALLQVKVRELLTGLGDRSLGIVSGLVFSIVSGLVAVLIFIAALYYFFADGTALLAATETLIPVHVEYQREMLQQFARVVRAVVAATFLAALGQAVAMTFALGICGFNHLLILFVLCLLSSLVPMLGTWLVWLPCAFLLARENHWGAAIFLAVWGSAVVGMLDNVIRTYVLNTDTKLHPLLALISVLGGIQVMGLWGVFIGPIVASCLHALVKIFNHELAALSKSRFGDHAVAAAEALAIAAVGPAAALQMNDPAPSPTTAVSFVYQTPIAVVAPATNTPAKDQSQNLVPARDS